MSAKDCLVTLSIRAPEGVFTLRLTQEQAQALDSALWDLADEVDALSEDEHLTGQPSEVSNLILDDEPLSALALQREG